MLQNASKFLLVEDVCQNVPMRYRDASDFRAAPWWRTDLNERPPRQPSGNHEMSGRKATFVSSLRRSIIGC